jgi:hypothetical protein
MDHFTLWLLGPGTLGLGTRVGFTVDLDVVEKRKVLAGNRTPFVHPTASRFIDELSCLVKFLTSVVTLKLPIN